MPLSQENAQRLLAIEGAVSAEEINYLYDLATRVRDGCIVEIGCCRGRSTAALAMGSRDGFNVPVYAVDPQEPFVGVYGGRFGPEDRGEFFKTMLALHLYPIVRLVNLSSDYLSSAWPVPVSLLWVDGDHRYAAVRHDIFCWLPKLRPDATIVFDDAFDPAVGPYHVIQELLRDGHWQLGLSVGKTSTLHRVGS